MTYLGGKEGEGAAQAIVNQQPPHTTYIEPFAGHAAVFRAKRAALRSILIDRDPDCIAWLAQHANGNIDLLTANALEWLPAQTFTPQTLIYCDPPYLIRSRSDPRTRYKFEFTVEDHEMLLQLLTSLPCMVQITCYEDKLYSSYLRDWRHVTFQSMTRRGLRTEHLYMSYPQPEALHTYTLLGRDYRERERIKRKVTRWTRRLETLPPLEKLALMSAMNQNLTENACRTLSPRIKAPVRAPASTVAVLFTHVQSNYSLVEGVETYDFIRDARSWPGGCPVVAHPPCAQWGRLRGLATDNQEEKALGPWAVQQVRRWGGVLEHPAGSTLWPACQMPPPGRIDTYGGWTLDIDQVLWGHPAQKHTWLYICGCKPEDVPELPPPGKMPTHVITSCRNSFHKLPALSKRGRELTPPDLCAWLVALARRCKPATPDKAAQSA